MKIDTIAGYNGMSVFIRSRSAIPLTIWAMASTPKMNIENGILSNNVKMKPANTATQ